MHWADTQLKGGLPHLLGRLQHWHTEFPNSPHLEPAPLLVECVQSGKTLAEVWKEKLEAKKAEEKEEAEMSERFGFAK
jgi:hypothetical protein